MKFERFKVTNYRNIRDSGWINLCDVTAFVGQNEAGKSNLFDALYRLNPFVESASYDIDEDWPVDDWENKADAGEAIVCEAEFSLDVSDIQSLYDFAALELNDDESEDNSEEAVENDEVKEQQVNLPEKLTLCAGRKYGYKLYYCLNQSDDGDLDSEKVGEWAKSNLPKFVYIHDYEMSGSQIELNTLKTKLDNAGGNWDALDADDQTILVILELAKIDLDEFLEKGQTSEGRTVRSFDKRQASSFLTSQFKKLWSQKEVRFDIEIDGPTLNIFVEDENVGMPVRLNRRSTGFRWYVSFAWKFTHATNGQFKDCILLLEEPGIHLHYHGQRDLLEVFDSLAESNTVLYTTHLASMVDLSSPERVRIVESRNNHLAITEGVVSTQNAPMAVIETSLGLTSDLSGMIGNRKVLIVEGGTDALILNKLSGLLKSSNLEGLSDNIYLWPAQTASKTPMYAAFAIGQKWDAAVLLDADPAGNEAKRKIDDLLLKKISEEDSTKFRVLMIKEAAGLNKTDSAIEDLFPDDFYIDCVNSAYGLSISSNDLPVDGSDMISTQIESVLRSKYHHSSLDKKRVLTEMLKIFDTWKTSKDLPTGAEKNAEKLIKKINALFKEEEIKK